MGRRGGAGDKLGTLRWCTSSGPKPRGRHNTCYNRGRMSTKPKTPVILDAKPFEIGGSWVLRFTRVDGSKDHVDGFRLGRKQLLRKVAQ
jgi:hypothetical protein